MRPITTTTTTTTVPANYDVVLGDYYARYVLSAEFQLPGEPTAEFAHYAVFATVALWVDGAWTEYQMSFAPCPSRWHEFDMAAEESQYPSAAGEYAALRRLIGPDDMQWLEERARRVLARALADAAD